MANLAVKIAFEPIRSLAAAAVVAGYTAVGTALSNPAYHIVLENFTDEDVMFSFDGVEDHIAVPSDGAYTLDITTNKTSTAGALYLPAGTIVYAKRIGTPTTGSVYVAVAYGNNGY